MLAQGAHYRYIMEVEELTNASDWVLSVGMDLCIAS